MSRPIKVGLDYFPLDVTIDDNVELLEAEHGVIGFGILVKLWQRIYRSGYYLKWDDDSRLLFCKNLNMELTIVDSIINSCFKRNIFSGDLFKRFGILTSSGIQKRYIKALSDCKRKSITLIKEFLLVNSEYTKLTTELTSLNSELSTQSKVKESKGNKRKRKHKKGCFKNNFKKPELSFPEMVKIWNKVTGQEQNDDLLNEFTQRTTRHESSYTKLISFLKIKGDLKESCLIYFTRTHKRSSMCTFKTALTPSKFVDNWEWKEENNVKEFNGKIEPAYKQNATSYNNITKRFN